MKHWRKDADLAGLRDPGALAQAPRSRAEVTGWPYGTKSMP